MTKRTASWMSSRYPVWRSFRFLQIAVIAVTANLVGNVGLVKSLSDDCLDVLKPLQVQE